MTFVAKGLTVLVGSCAVGFAIAAAALAGGGSTIANAPDLPIGTKVTGAQPYAGNLSIPREYWGITVSARDMLVIAYGSDNEYIASVCLYPPSTTDATEKGTDCATYNETVPTQAITYTVPSAGRWILKVARLGYSDLAYHLTVEVKHATRASLSGPASVRARHVVALRGAIAGLSAGKVKIQLRGKAGWTTLAQVAVKADGSFRYTFRAGAAGLLRLRAIFAGDATHLAANALLSVRIH